MTEIIDDMVRETEPEKIKDNRRRYKGVCPLCGKENWICKSVAMEVGINSGHGRCLGCGTFMHIQFNTERQEMDLEPFEEYIKREQAKKDVDAIAESMGYGGIFKDDE